MFYIYGLHLEGDDEIRYVGSTCDPNSRFLQHLYGHDGHNPTKSEWVAANQQRLRMKILQRDVSERDRRLAEQKAIMECRGKGHRLFNGRNATNKKFVTTEDVTWWLDRIEGNKPY